VSQQTAFPVFSFEGQKVLYRIPHPVFCQMFVKPVITINLVKLSWITSHYYQRGRVGSD